MTQNFALPRATEYQLRIREIRFARSLELGSCDALIHGFLQSHSGADSHPFTIRAHFDPTKRLWWTEVRTLRWTSPVPKSFFDFHNIESICRELANSFRLFWMQPVPGPNESGARIRIGQTFMTEEQTSDAFSILRGDILSVYRLAWPRLWPAIENRLMYDPEFWVNGFTRQDAVDAAKILKTVFHWEWVRRRYRKVAQNKSDVGMWDAMEADQGFPAYVLARTAIGCICKDPGWNYLITLAKYCKLLKSFPKGVSLLERIATEPGFIHQANFSGYLLERQLLAEVDPPTGSGNAKHDMAVRVGDVTFDIEMKALTSCDPARRVTREVLDKCKKIPSAPRRPVVFFVLLVETSTGNDHKSCSEQLDSITADVFRCTTGVSSLVIGRMFVDSAGGPVKWSFDKFVTNNHAMYRIHEESLRLVFEPNWQRLTHPVLPIVFSYNLRDKEDGKK